MNKVLAAATVMGGVVISWKKANGNAPADSLVAGHNVDDEPIYIAREEYEGDLVPGKLVSIHKAAFIPWGGKEITQLRESKAVVMPWVPAKNGEVPQGADYAGFNKAGERIYIARAEHQGALIPGKVITSNGCAFVSWGGLAFQKQEYEVLVDGPKNWVSYKGPKIPLKAFPGGKTENHEVLFIGRVTYKDETTPGKASNGDAPANSLVAGYDVTGEPIYVARAEHEGDLVPGKLVSSHKGAFLPWGGMEISKKEYEVLIKSNNQWVADRGGNVPANALKAGRTKSGETLYIGRVHYLKSITPGKVHPSHVACYISFDGKELNFSDYEVLLEN
ncbi:hypothetical protein KGM_201504 [Danaus plexippus plexippus]|uniref:Uncharacterized protein n=1 Tax=Danaus plexippus plexippus TaxID=278856 RepID=A0A212EL23_DANPL|nr:hypothetical protein KGM_201504 [Danaus plexippus plexippus]